MDVKKIISNFKEIRNDGIAFLERCTDELNEEKNQLRFIGIHSIEHGKYKWSSLPKESRLKSAEIVKQLIEWSKTAVILVKKSMLTEQVDLTDFRVSVKKARSAILLRRYMYEEVNVVSNEDHILGIQPSMQKEEKGFIPSEALRTFNESCSTISQVLQLTDDSGIYEGEDILIREQPLTGYQKDSAFIMMWMDPGNPSLEDIKEVVKDVFAQFDIKAVRADEIEHESVITDKIRDKIKSSEFLFADLTGARPNVYYEVGYAHALGKRVILYREEGEPLHFDLAGYNCPSYKNNTDLKKQLHKRLEHLTGKSI